jgi:hypothetical protein
MKILELIGKIGKLKILQLVHPGYDMQPDFPPTLEMLSACHGILLSHSATDKLQIC